MLRVRVFMNPSAQADAMIWDAVAPVRDESKALQTYRELSWDGREIGVKHTMNFSDAAGRKCRVEGRFMGAEISEVEGGHQVDLTFDGDKYRVW